MRHPDTINPAIYLRRCLLLADLHPRRPQPLTIFRVTTRVTRPGFAMPDVLVLIFFCAVVLVALYWVIRLAVRHAIQDADKRSMTRGS